MKKITMLIMTMMLVASLGCSSSEETHDVNSPKEQSEKSELSTNKDVSKGNNATKDAQIEEVIMPPTVSEVECQEPVPPFMYVDGPSMIVKRIDMCTCIWNNLPEEMRPLSKMIREGELGNATNEELNTFYEKFGQAMSNCNK